MARKPSKSKRATVKQVQATEAEPFELPPVDARPEIDDDEPSDLNDGLNMRRRLFVEHITGAARGNATLAAKMAGYSDSNSNVLKATASRLLTFVDVQRAIRERMSRVLLTAEGTRQAIAAYASASMEQFAKVDENGNLAVDWRMAAACGAIGSIKEIKEDLLPGDGDKKEDVIKRTFKIRDPMPALALLAKMHGLVDGDAAGGEEPAIRTRPIDRHANAGRN